MKRNNDLVTYGGQPVTLKGRLIKEGLPAKNFMATTADIQPFRLSDYQGKVRIISSVLGVDNDVCARQTRRFNLEALKMDDVQVISISCDLPFALKRFCAEENIANLIAISDQKDNDFGVKYGLLLEEFGTLTRAVVVIDKDDTVRHFQLVPEITAQPDYDKVFEEVNKLI